MAAIRCDIRRRSPQFGEKARFELRFPLTERAIIEAELVIGMHSPPVLQVQEARFDATSVTDSEGILRIGTHVTGISSAAFAREYALAGVRDKLLEIGETTLAVTIAKRFETRIETAAALGPSERAWGIDPGIAGPIKPFAKYLLLRTSGDEPLHSFGYMEMTDDLNAFRHALIWERFPGSANLGGGFFTLSHSRLALQESSHDFGYAPFDLAYDAAKAVVQAAQAVVPVTQLIVEGKVQYDFSLAAA